MKRGWMACLLALICCAAVSCDDSRTAKIEDVTCGLDCSKNAGGRIEVCVFLGGVESCKPKCFGEVEGVNKAVCQVNDATAVPVTKSAVDTCAKDELGTLYSIDTAYETCVTACNDGVCDNTVPGPVTCNQTGDREVAAFTINGTETCKNKCLGQQAGENKLCVHDSSGGAQAVDKSAVDTCAKDDKGALYSTETKYADCANGCDETTHDCKPETLVCNSIGGRPEVAVVIDGAAECRKTCLGAAVGQNPVCWHNASAGPNAKAQALVDTCAKDDNGVLYSQSSTESEACDYGCADGECLPELVCNPECVGNDGGRDTVCVLFNNAPTCKPRCLGNAEGVNPPVCDTNPSLPSPKPFSVIDTCVKDVYNTLYLTEESRSECPASCNATTGMCE